MGAKRYSVGTSFSVRMQKPRNTFLLFRPTDGKPQAGNGVANAPGGVHQGSNYRTSISSMGMIHASLWSSLNIAIKSISGHTAYHYPALTCYNCLTLPCFLGFRKHTGIRNSSLFLIWMRSFPSLLVEARQPIHTKETTVVDMA